MVVQHHHVLAVEGMMLVTAIAGYSTALHTGNDWLEERRADERDADQHRHFEACTRRELLLRVADAHEGREAGTEEIERQPVGYWLVLSQITSSPNTAASRAPASAPAPAPAPKASMPASVGKTFFSEG